MFGGAYRKKSDKYGAVVWLCGNKCHREGQQSVHKNIYNNRFLKRIFQRRIMEREHWDMERWIQEFGKNYFPPIPGEERYGEEEEE